MEPQFMEPQFDEKKFGELIVYLAMKCQDDAYFGATKLNKLLFYSDFVSYKRTGCAITGAEYRALQHGPAPRQLLPVRGKLEQEGAIAQQTWGPQNRIVALRKPNLDAFSESERAIVDEMIEHFSEYDTGAIVQESHTFLGWRAAMAERARHPGREGPIPYRTALVSAPPVREAERAHIMGLAKKYEWNRQPA